MKGTPTASKMNRRKIVLKKRKEKAANSEFKPCFQSPPITPWKNISHLNARKIVETSTQRPAEAKMIGKLKKINAQYMDYHPSTWCRICSLSNSVALPSGLQRISNCKILPMSDNLKNEESVDQKIACTDNHCINMNVPWLFCAFRIVE